MKELPVMRSLLLYSDLRRLSTSFVVEFSKKVLPLLSALGLSDDESIRKYIWSVSFEDIYKDAAAIGTAAAKEKDRDFWQPIRADNSKAWTPGEKGFVFKLLPLAIEPYRDKFLKAISVKDGFFTIHDKILKEECIVKPEPWKVECFGMVDDFCERLKSRNPEKRNAFKLFAYDTDGNLTPNISGIFGKVAADPPIGGASEPWMEECFGMVSEFCEMLKAKKFYNRRNIRVLFAHDGDGTLTPNISGIFWGNNGIH